MSAHSVVYSSSSPPWFFPVDCASTFLLPSFSLGKCLYPATFHPPCRRPVALLMQRQKLEPAVCCCQSSLKKNIGRKSWCIMWERSAESGKSLERGWAVEEQFSRGSVLKLAGTFLLVTISLHYFKLILKLQWVKKHPSFLNLLL